MLRVINISGIVSYIMNTIKIENKNWKLEIDLNGGKIVNLEKDGQQILGTFERIDGKIANTHICVPNFDQEGMEEYGLLFHGPCRNAQWKLIKESENMIRIGFEFEGTEKYLSSLLIEQEFSLGDSFRHKIRVKNTGNNEVPVNIAIHNYWASKEGWLGLKINEVDISQIVKDDDYFDTKDENIVLFPDGRKFNLNLKGFNYVRLWTARKEEGSNTIYDQNCVGVEPSIGKGSYFGSEESMLKVGEIREVEQELL